MEKTNKTSFVSHIIMVFKGVLVGFGAILPGVSGGTLCYVFGIYDQVLEILTAPIKGIKKHWLMLIFVGIGGGIGCSYGDC